MEGSWHYRKREEYKGYEIWECVCGTGGYTDYFFIGKDGERESMMALISPKAAKNVIDTYIKHKTFPQIWK